MRGLMIVFRILIFCLRLVGEMVSGLLCYLAFWIVPSFCRFYLSDGISWISRFVYDSFCIRVGKFLDL